MSETAADLARRLARTAEGVCRHYLSNGRREGRTWRVGDVDNNPGRSLMVRLAGPDSGKGAAGHWIDFATGGVTQWLASRVAANERLARQRGRELATQTRVNQLVIEDMHDGVLVLDRAGRVVQHNPQAQRLLGAGPLLGSSIATLVPGFAGRADIEARPERARLGRDLPANDERADFLRATLAEGPTGLVATPLPVQDSSLMAPLARADCLVIREPHAPPARAGSDCVMLKLGL